MDAYRAQLGVGDDEIAMGVVVQVMVPAEAAGVLLTLDPLTETNKSIEIRNCTEDDLRVVHGLQRPPSRRGLRGSAVSRGRGTSRSGASVS